MIKVMSRDILRSMSQDKNLSIYIGRNFSEKEEYKYEDDISA
jgi:hypothetical protein